MESRDKHLKSMMLKQVEELQEACRALSMTRTQVQQKQQLENQAKTRNVSSSRWATQPHVKGQRHRGNPQDPLVFKTAESHSSPADQSSDHPAARHGHQAPKGARNPRNPHPKSGQKETGEMKARTRSTGPRGGQLQGQLQWQLQRQPQQGQRRSESVTVKDRIGQRDWSEPRRRTPKSCGSQPNLFAFARESNGTNETQRPRGRQPFSKGKERCKPQTTCENYSQQFCKRQLQFGMVRPLQDFKPAEQCSESDHQKQGTLDSQKLMQLAAKDPVDIVMKLAAPKSGLKEFLNQTNAENNLIASFLKILAMTFSCKSNQRSLHYVLELIKNSMFLKNLLPIFVVGAQMEVSRETNLENSENLGYALTLLNQVLTVYPASAFLDVSLLATLVQSTSNYMQSIGFPISEESEKSLQKLHQMIALLQEKKRQGNLQSDTYTYFVSPNGNDFRQISIYPTHDDIHLINKPFIRPNIINEEYPDTATYLDIQFRLLREDFVRPLRDGISKLLSCDQKDLQRQQIDDIRIYFNACILGPLCTYSGVFYRVQFDKTFLKHVQWETSQRLLYGSFLCLSKDNFETMLFATVVHRNVQELTNGIVTLRFTESSRLALVDVKSRDTFLMVESTAYFEAYRHVLEGIKEIKDNEMPFQKYIVQCQTNIGKPKYLENAYQSYTLEPLLKEQEDETPMNFINRNSRRRLIQTQSLIGDIFDFAKWPSKERLKFDESQMAALQTALTKELAIIQGPPGTGKTFLGLKVVSVLLANMHIWQSTTGSPILVVCYTNHALDQFLEGIHAFLKTGLVRVGGRSSSTIVAGFSLKELRKKNRSNLPSYLRNTYPVLINEREEMQKEIELLAVASETSMKGILQLRHLSGYIQMNHLKSLQMGSEHNPSEQHVIMEWLKLASLSELEYNFALPKTLEQLRDEDMWETASSASEGDVGNLMEEREDDDELIQVTAEADMMQAERIIDDDDLQNQLQKARARQVAMEEQFLAFNPDENAAPCKSQAENQDGDDWQFTDQEKKRMKKMVKKQLKLTDIMPENEAECIVNIWNLNLHDRWRLYRLWLSKYQAETKHAIWKCELEYQRIVDRLEELRNQEEILLLRQSKVVGMTTTGAAKYRNLLQDIKPRIVIMEEAAEILETHIITSLTSACQHLVLIGDHQQLHPSATVYELARNFNLEVSLFERLVMMEVPYVRLDYQHRMRPEITKLITPHIYDKLENTVSVTLYENIKGVSANLYFIEHQEPEDKMKEGKSYQNSHEAHFVKSLCEYFIRQEYKPSQITILTTYSGQLFCLRKIMPKRVFDGVRVCVLDKYQGEENDIVILSLVRSNKQGMVGFLRVPNRVCVALSRAKKGFYCIGNMSLLAKQVRLWGDIVGMLRDSGNIGSSLQLCCQNHPRTNTLVSCASDFAKVPMGGCLVPCNFHLKCDHLCTFPCHPFDPMHKQYKCCMPCQNLCDMGHQCPKRCWEDCNKCLVKVDKVIPKCGHCQQVACFMPPEQFCCQEPCGKTLACGHPCIRLCGDSCTRRCPQRIELVRDCGHKQMVQCFQHQEAEDWPCSYPCGSCCPHGKCPRRCGEPCQPCREPCSWACPHAQCTRLCHEPCNRVPCDLSCGRTLDCGHPCIGLCGEPCPNKCRICHVEEVTEIFFGGEDQPDTRFLQLQDCQHIFAVKEFDRLMQLSEANDFPTSKLCLCPKCSTPIQNSLRYGAIVKSARAEIESSKAKILGDEEVGSCKEHFEHFQAGKEELTKSYSKKTQDLRVERQQSSFNLPTSTTLGHKVSFLSKISDLKSKRLQYIQRFKTQENW